MQRLNGPISDRLRRLFGAKDTVWTPGRPADVAPRRGGTPTPGHVDGHKLGGRHRRTRGK